MAAEPNDPLTASRPGSRAWESEQTASASVWQPLAGVRVADFSALLPGPLTGAMLGDLGADVVKVEPLAGDGARRRTVLRPILENANRNKESLLLDLKRPEAAQVVHRLACWADVTLESFRPGVAHRLGIDHAHLSTANPRIITCSLSGYGQTGPWRDAPGHDLNFLAAAGAFAAAGHWGEQPRRSGMPVADLLGAGTAAIAILAALRERDATGVGRALDVALMDATLFGVSVRHGLETDESAPSPYPTNDLFVTADGRQIALAVGSEEHLWRNFRTAIAADAPAILEPRFDSDASRRTHGDVLFALLTATFATRDAAYWLRLLGAADVPVSLCLTPREAAATAQAHARGFVQEQAGRVLSVLPVAADGRRPRIRRAAPAAGGDTRSVLGRIGCSHGEIDALLASGVAAVTPTATENA